MMHGKLPQPVLHVVERLSVRRQDQRVGMQYVEKGLASLQERADRVELRPDVPGVDIGGDARKDLIAGNQDLPLGAVERYVLRRMALADDDPPAISADADEVVAAQPDIALRQSHAVAVEHHAAEEA